MLLDRGKRQVALTNCCILFQQRTKEIISLLDKTEQDLAKQKSTVGGTVSIVCVESAASHALPDLLEHHRPSHFHIPAEHELVRENGIGGVGGIRRQRRQQGRIAVAE